MTWRLGWPRSLFGRHVLLIVGLILCAEVGITVAFHQLVQMPRIERMTEMSQRYLDLLGRAMAQMDPGARQGFVAALAQDPVPVLLVQARPDHVTPPTTLLMRVALQRLRERLGPGVEVAWSEQPVPRLWLRTEVAGRSEWLGLDASALPWPRGRLILGVMLGAGLLAVLGAALIQRQMHRPLQRLQDAAGRVAAGEYPHFVAQSAPSEIAALSEAFERMTRQLESNEQERALMLAGLSHDLRTPLAKLRLAVEILRVEGEEALQDGMVRNIVAADQVIEQFIDFARQGAGEMPSLCDAEELVRDVAAGFNAARVRVSRSATELPPLPCRPLALRRALANLLENALKYSAGEVQVGLERCGAMLCIAVCDQGPGVPEHELERVRRPFTRLDQSRGGPPGAGLGLAIVERVLRQAGGRLELRSPGGLEARMLLPLAGD